ncbi:hypothetical protein, partial [Victivallis lenta]|uniref:hypothetical protein n=1 Tax=Victivallis lenta TaxID=2606640 RepID=UPI003AB87620
LLSPAVLSVVTHPFQLFRQQGGEIEVRQLQRLDSGAGEAAVAERIQAAHHRAVVGLSVRLPGDYRIYVLRSDGSRGAELKPERSGGELRLWLDNFRDGNALAYELLRNR